MSFPLNSNQAYVKDTGERSTLGAELSSGGSQYILPTASADTLGGVKIGSGLSITEEGVLSASGGGGGGHVYLHQLLVTHSTNRKIALSLYTSASTAISKDDLFDLLYNDGTPRTIYGMNAGSSVSYGLTANMDGDTKRFAFIDTTGTTNIAIANALLEETVIQF